jgi:hypothetical protein
VPPLEPSAGPERRRWVPAPRHGGLGDWLACLAGAGLLCFLTFYAKGGLNVETLIPVEIVLTLLAGVVLVIAAVRLPARAPAWGLVPALLLAAFAVLSAVSLIWSVQPEESLRDAGRLLAYTGVFAAAVVLARIAPTRWPAVLGALILAAVAFCVYALITKTFPDHFAAANKYARLYEPFGYWNAIGLAAAMGAMGCMWLGGRRAGHALLSALAYPAMGLLLTTLMLAYSRGALVALALGLVLWFVLVPLRLRGAAVLIAGGLCAGAVTAWDFSNHALSSEGAELAERVSAGHELGALVLAMVALLTLLGVGLAFAAGGHGAAGSARCGRARLLRRTRAQPPRLHPQHLPRLAVAHQHARHRAQHAGSPDRHRQRPRGLLGPGAEGLQGQPGDRRRRRRLRSREPALPRSAADRQTRPRLRLPDARRPRHRRRADRARPPPLLAVGGRTLDAPVQPTLARLAGGAQHAQDQLGAHP